MSDITPDSTTCIQVEQLVTLGVDDSIEIVTY